MICSDAVYFMSVLLQCQDFATRLAAAFLRTSALPAMQSTVLVRAILSACPSVTFRCFAQTNKDTIVQFSSSGRTILLVSGEAKFIRIFAGDYPSEGVEVRHPSIDSKNLTNYRP